MWRLEGVIVPATRRGEVETRLRVSAGTTPISTRSEVTAGASGCNARTRTERAGARVVVHEPSAAVVTVAKVVSRPIPATVWMASGAPASGGPPRLLVSAP